MATAHFNQHTSSCEKSVECITWPEASRQVYLTDSCPNAGVRCVDLSRDHVQVCYRMKTSHIQHDKPHKFKRFAFASDL